MAIAHPPPKPSLLGDLGIGSFGSQILERLKALPASALVIESIEHWWAEHPLHAAGALAEEASRRYVGPIARKNPVAVVVGGVVFGALLRRLRALALAAAARPVRRPCAADRRRMRLKRMPLDAWLHDVVHPHRQARCGEGTGRTGPGIRLAKATLHRLPPNGPLPTRPRGISAGLPPWGL